jgi:hypothetical protein
MSFAAETQQAIDSPAHNGPNPSCNSEPKVV